MLRSLRLQLFLGIFVILLGAGTFIMMSTRQEVERALIEAESRSARNVSNLIELNVSNRYRELLREKVRIVTERRGSLQQLGGVVSATMESFDSLVAPENLSRSEAENLALDWVDQLQLDQSATAFVMGNTGKILTHPEAGMIGQDLGELPDHKGRSIITAIEEEISNYGYAFVIFDDSKSDIPGRDGRRFAYFKYVPAFGVYIGISDTIDDVESHVQAGVSETIEILADTVSRVQVVETGFVFIFDNQLNSITPPPQWASQLLAQRDPVSQSLVLELFRQAGAREESNPVHYELDIEGTVLAMEAYVSFFRPLGWYVVSTAPSAEIAKPASLLVQRQVVIFSTALLASLLLAWIFATTITGPLQRLTAYARALPEHDFTSKDEYPLELKSLGRGRSEVGGLARAFLFMDHTLRANIKALLETTRAKERIESELNIAREIQHGLLPKIFPPFPLRPQIDLHAALYPARHVGGDLFDFYFVDEHRLLFTVGDVADKGVPSALFMAITKTLVKSASTQESTPARMMERVNNDLSADNPNAMFVTLFIGVLDLRNGNVDYVNAGQNPPLLMAADSSVSFLSKLSGPPAGAMENVHYKPLRMNLQPGDILVVYTDGITEAMDIKNQEYGNDRLVRLITHLKDKSAANIVSALIDDVRIHSGKATQSDDITALCLSWRGCEEHSENPSAEVDGDNNGE